MGSLLVAVRSLLTDALADLPEFADAETTFGYKVGSKRREKCWTQNARFKHETAGLRPVKTFRNESGTFELVILIEGVALSVEETSTRAMELGHAAEDWVATKANWEGAITGLKWITVSGDGALAEAFNDKGSLAELTYPITFEARLT
jgi:hypothetical protein